MKSKDTVNVSGDVQDLQPRGLLHALSEIEQFSVAEREGSPIPEEAVTTKILISFFNVGLKTATVSAVATALLSPFMFAVQENIIPVFGSYDPNAFDKVFVFLLTTGLSIFSAFFIFILLRNLYIGNVTKKVIHTLVCGLVAGTLFSTIVIIILYHILYFNYLTPDALAGLFYRIPESMRPGSVVYYRIAIFCENLIPGAYFQAAINVFFMAVVASTIIAGKIRTRRLKQYIETWR